MGGGHTHAWVASVCRRNTVIQALLGVNDRLSTDVSRWRCCINRV
ncbi:MAG: hypothetical protein V3Q69_01860 [Burkholderia sp.]